MFGQNDNKQPDDQIPEHSIQGALNSDDGSATPADTAQPGWGHPGTPLAQPQVVHPSGDDEDDTTTSPTAGTNTDQSVPPPAYNTDLIAETPTDQLIDIKQKALTQLSPLVGHLDQTPEEKFRTTMMMIQASDDQGLIPVAYEAANAIADEKAKAQALLDIVNEINYFTSQHQN